MFLEGINYQTIDPIALRRRIMLVSQEPKLLGMKVREALAYPLQLQELDPAAIVQRIATITEQFQIPPDWFERTEVQLSIGQKQLISIARGIITQPQVLLLDEPIANLDLIAGEGVLTIVRMMARTHQMGVIIVNHQLELAEKFSDKLLYLKDGTLSIELASNSVNWQDIQQQIRESERQLIAEWE